MNLDDFHPHLVQMPQFLTTIKKESLMKSH